MFYYIVVNLPETPNWEVEFIAWGETSEIDALESIREETGEPYELRYYRPLSTGGVYDIASIDTRIVCS